MASIKKGLPYILKLLVTASIVFLLFVLFLNSQLRTDGEFSTLSVNRLDNSRPILGKGGSDETNIIFVVVAAAGVAVREEVSAESAYIGILPEGSIIHQTPGASVDISGSRRRLKIDFPYEGWITAQYMDDVLVREMSLGSKSSMIHALCNSADFKLDYDTRSGDLPGGPLKVTAPEQCCELCSTNPKCFAWTLTKDGSCWLKDSSSTMVKKQDNSGFVSAALPDGARKRGSRPACCSGANQGSMKISFEDFRDGLYDSSAREGPSFTLKQNADSVGWASQWPVGTGKSGALVGGSIHSEIVPLSTAGLFVSKKPKTSPKSDRNSEYKKARDLFLSGKLSDSSKAANAMGKDLPSLGMFQYAADIGLVFSSAPLIPSKGSTSRAPIKRSKGRRALRDIRPGESALQYIQNLEVEEKFHIGADGRKKWPFHLFADNKKKVSFPNGDSYEGGVKDGKPHGFGIMEFQSDELYMGEFKNGEIHGEGKYRLLNGRVIEGVFDNGYFKDANGETICVKSEPMRVLNKVPSVKSPVKAATKRNTHIPAGRQAVIDQLKSRFVGQQGISKTPNLGRRYLDMANGMIHSFFVEPVKEGPSHRLHHREWFGSENHDVVASRMTCIQVPSAKSGCFNGAVQLERSSGNGQIIPVSSKAKPWSMKPIRHNHKYATTYELELSFGPHRNKFDTLNVPDVHVCGIAICWADGHAAESQVLKAGISPPALVCNNADGLDLFFSVSLNNSISHDVRTVDPGIMDHRKHCLKRLLKGASAQLEGEKNQARSSYEILRNEHSKQFSTIMRRVEIQLKDNGKSNEMHDKVCAGALLESRLGNLDTKCSSVGRKLKTVQTRPKSKVLPQYKLPSINADVELIQQFFQFSRYLILSAGSHAPTNLQGLWADGPTSAWNGDYHLNINMEQNYWGANAAGIGEVLPPLFNFVKNLAQEGELTARDLYKCQGWVAHGFTDNTMNGGLRGAPHWGLCVTCGAWLSLHLWEHLSYSDTKSGAYSALLLDSLRIFRGVAIFFQQYMIEDQFGTKFTGPTTSPENSYHMTHNKLVNKTVKDLAIPGKKAKVRTVEQLTKMESFHHLTLSPAFDISILRQIANAFTILVAWGKAHVHSYTSEEYQNDYKLALQFSRAVQQMTGKGLPVVGKSGLIVEYPDPSPGVLRNMDVEASSLRPEKRKWRSASAQELYITPLSTNGLGNITESKDRGHRHFSSLHWLYPGHFLPSGHQGRSIFQSGGATVRAKSSARGGHTGWSAMWEGCLYARLRDAHGAWSTVSKILHRFTSANFFAMHPPLSKLPGVQTCETCFEEKRVGQQYRRSFTSAAAPQRGLETVDGDKFQIDAHGGAIGLVSEMHLQSHVPGTYILLPALLNTNSQGSEEDIITASHGFAHGLRARGDVVAETMVWTNPVVPDHHTGSDNAMLDGAMLLFQSPHPWLLSHHWVEYAPGFFEEDPKVAMEGTRHIAFIHSRTKVNLICPDILDEKACAVPSDMQDKYVTENFFSLSLEIRRFPCRVKLCAHDVCDFSRRESRVE
jgi:hypothetical protein